MSLDRPADYSQSTSETPQAAASRMFQENRIPVAGQEREGSVVSPEGGSESRWVQASGVARDAWQGIKTGAGEGWQKAREGWASLETKYDRWVMSGACDQKIRENGEDINTLTTEIRGIDEQVLSPDLPEAEVIRLFERQAALEKKVVDLAGERQRAATFLSSYHGENIQKPLDEAKGHEATLRDSAKEQAGLQDQLDAAKDAFATAKQALISLRKGGKCTNAEWTASMRKMKSLSDEISKIGGQVTEVDERMANAKQKLTDVLARHGSKIEFAKQLREISIDGRNRTLAAPRRVTPEQAVDRANTKEAASTARTETTNSGADEVGEALDFEHSADIMMRSILGDVPDRLRAVFNRLGRSLDRNKEIATDSLVDKWNAFADKEPRIRKIESYEKKRLTDFKSKMTLMEFGTMVRLTLIMSPQEIQNGITRIANSLIEDEKGQEKKVA